MKRRILPLSLLIASAVVVYACSSDETPATPPVDVPPVDEAGTPVVDSSVPVDSSIPDSSKADTSVPSGNPIEGIAAPVAVPILTAPPPGVYTEGPQWFGDGLYFAEAKPDGFLVKLTPPNTVAQVRPVVTAGTTPIGTTYNEKTMKLLTIEVSNPGPGAQLIETPTTGALPRTGTPLVLTTDAGAPPAFDSPNDLVVRKSDGTIYLSDPGYQTGAAVVTNHIWRIKPITNEVFETVAEGRPNGIALSPNDSILYVSFTDPELLAPPTVMKYPVNADGSLGVATKLLDLLPGGDQDVNSLADGLAVDSAGNVYVATRTGVEVIKPDGTKWGKITPVPARIINGVAFGGADKKTLFMTSNTGMLSVTVKVAGLVQ